MYIIRDVSKKDKISKFKRQKRHWYGTENKNKMIIKFTKHAEEMLKERNIDRNLVLFAVQNPDWKETTESELWYAFKRVGRKVLRVVIKGEEKPYTVITIYYNKRLRK